MTKPTVAQPAAPALQQLQPQLIFATELESHDLRHLLADTGVLAHLVQHGCGVAMAMVDLNDTRAEIVRLLNHHRVYTVAWLAMSPDEGYWFHLQNYPQAIARYRAFHAWAHQHSLRFDAIGLDIEPPLETFSAQQGWRLRDLAHLIWLAQENVLYPAARTAYHDLVVEIRHDGYEVHSYQLPLIADDHRMGTTLLQRALDVVALPADLEVLMCHSSLPFPALHNDLEGALIRSYGPAADSIGVGHVGGYTRDEYAGLPVLSWGALQRDLLLAASYTDTLYIFSLEGCVAEGFLPRIAALEWSEPPPTSAHHRLLVDALRLVLLVVLGVARFYKVAFAWAGWILALIFFVRNLRRKLRQRGAK